MRILTVCTSWRVFGAETITLKMIEGFRNRGHHQLAVTSTFTDGEFSRRLKALGIPEIAMPFGVFVASLSPRYIKWTLDSAVRWPVLWWRWRRALKDFRPDVIVWTSSRQPFFLLPCLSRKTPPSFLIEFTSLAPTKNMRWLFRHVREKVTGFIAVSDYMRGHLQTLGAQPETIHVVKSGAFFAGQRRELPPEPLAPPRNAGSPVRVGIVGQVAPNKGHDCLVEAVRLLRGRGTKVVVHVFGSGGPQYMSRLKGKIAEANLTGVWNWMGYERDKAKIFGSMDVCVVPSCFGDPFPTVAMEAGVYGLPVVASRIGGLPEIIEDGVTGWLVEPNSPAQLADKLEWFIKNPDRAREMGSTGRTKVFQQFTVEKMVAEFEALFSEFAKK